MKQAGIALALALAVIAASRLRVSALERSVAAERYEDVYYLPPPAWLVVFSLGHREALADLVWTRALVYLGEAYAEGAGLPFVFDYADAMLALDPDFEAVYRWVATAGVYQPVEVPVESLERTIAILERGRARFPEDGRLAWLTGATLSFELAPRLPAGPAREDARLRGAEHLLDASRLGAAPDWMILSTSSQLATLGEAERAIEALEEMYATVSDDAVREEISSRIASIRSDAYGRAFAEANDAFEHARLRRYPYLHPALYFLVAPSADESYEAPLREGWGRVLIDELTPADEGDGDAP